jgi:hypothetical protein
MHSPLPLHVQWLTRAAVPGRVGWWPSFATGAALARGCSATSCKSQWLALAVVPCSPSWDAPLAAVAQVEPALRLDAVLFLVAGQLHLCFLACLIVCSTGEGLVVLSTC